jgi:serine protease Do
LAPTAAPVLPTNTPSPQPEPTNTTAPPPPPPPQSNQGCYLFENRIDAELNVTFTAVDRNWADSFKINPMGTKEYCLDPGRYTYTIDAPPPWGSTNGDLQVNAGDRFRWPIEGR